MVNLFSGDLVRLGAPQNDDNEQFAAWTHNPDYLRLMDTDPARPMSAEAYGEWEKNIVGPNTFLFRIRTLAEDAMIGFVALDVTWANQHAFVAIGIGDSNYWGKGYGTDAMRVTLRYAFQELSLHRVGLSVIAYNKRAIASYEKLGFVFEGAQREYLLRDGQRYDLCYYGILRHEWEAHQR